MNATNTGAMGTDEARFVRERLESSNGSCRTRYGTFSECPLCGAALIPEHAHFKCRGCGWRDSCCD